MHPDPTIDKPLDIDELMREIRADIAARLPDADDETLGRYERRPAIAADAPDARLPRLGELTLPLARKDAYRVGDFLAYHDADFVRNAYRALLGREPDPEGGARYLAKIRSGQLSRVEVLGRIRYSPEGKASRVRVDGLFVPFALRTARRVPVLGRLLGIAQYVWRLPDIARNHEMLEAAMFEQRAAMRDRINEVVAGIEHAIEQVKATEAERFSALGSRDTDLQARILDVRSELRRLSVDQQAQGNAAKAADEALEAKIVGIGERASGIEGRLSAVGDRVSDVASDVAKAGRNLEALRDGNQALAQVVAQLGGAQALIARVAAVEREANALRAALPSQSVATSPSAFATSMAEGFYVAFEDRFRGTREDIKGRLSVYLPLVDAAGAGGAEAPILDVGCGRGEWLELLRDHALAASGVDTNEVAVAGCRARGLSADAGDGVEHLRARASESLGAVTAIHVIEHLPFEGVLALFDESKRVLRSGGVAIFETPNPENLVVGACNFYYDPTHVRPLPPEPLRFILESRGFERVDIMRLHPDDAAPALDALPDALASAIKERLFGPRDYALIAYKR
ncbi:MAG TPA: methyltransferase domain-containing protein [Casimicrobiaceae bacterium]|nr:methyltransferase domain-containing protein [Casimicrobiaceae bacterium]